MVNKTYLALGDSYTIGEQVPYFENYPNQVVQLMRKEGYGFTAPEIVAKTGWTTDELQMAINEHIFSAGYDFVSLLIGVNNQYRGRSVTEYEEQFSTLLNQAIRFAGNNRDHVLVLSIPDWGVTPFASTSDREKIRAEIDQFNVVNRNITIRENIHYIYITELTREAEMQPGLVATDGLHPSGLEYQRWAKRIADFFKSKIN